MRKQRKQDILECIQTVYSGMEWCRDNFESDSFSAVCRDCLDSLKMVCNIVETEAAAQEAAMLTQCINSWSNEADMQTDSKSIQEKLDILTEWYAALEKAIHVKLEVVFLPYKASMWDSLASIYDAAGEDPDCDPYLIPIPYYEKNSDGSPRRMVYEGNLYPENVPVTDYHEYDFESRMPDIIYIHNAYDNDNYVTSVLPEFYTDRLKQYTQMLVYVPYFLVMNDDIGEHLCLVSGIRNIDRIIVQSEKVKKQYQEYLEKYWDVGDRIQGIGSPKCDITNKEKEQQLPPEWEMRIRGRKIILYNTHLDNLLNHETDVFKKLLYVFHKFSEWDEAVLWWRPHPLSEATLAAMKPEYMDTYLKIKKQFVEQQWGILDDTPLLHRALNKADAYYGDGSSLVELYNQTHKPILLQNVEINTKQDGIDDNKYVNFYYGLIEEEGMWLAGRDYNAFFFRDRRTGEIQLLGSFPGENADAKDLYGKIFSYQDKLLLIPFNAQSFAVWNKSSRSFEMIPIRNGQTGCKFYAAVMLGEAVYVLPRYYSSFIIFHMSDNNLEYRDDWMDVIHQNVNMTEYFASACCCGDKIYAPLYLDNRLVEIDTENNSILVHQIGSGDYRFRAITCNENDIWLVEADSSLAVRWNRTEKDVKEYRLLPADVEKSSKVETIGAFLYGCELWVLYHGIDISVKMNIRTETITPVKTEFSKYRLHYVGGEFWCYCGMERIGKLLYLFPCDADRMLILNLEKEVILQEKIHLSVSNLFQLLHDKGDWEKPFYEGSFYTLSDFVNCVDKGTDKRMQDMSIGRQIHQYICGEVWEERRHE